MEQVMLERAAGCREGRVELEEEEVAEHVYYFRFDKRWT